MKIFAMARAKADGKSHVVSPSPLTHSQQIEFLVMSRATLRNEESGSRSLLDILPQHLSRCQCVARTVKARFDE